MFVSVVAPKEASFGKAAKTRRVRPSEDSVADQERDAAVAPARFSWSLRNSCCRPRPTTSDRIPAGPANQTVRDTWNFRPC